MEKWCSESGFCDWIIPQIYYGLDNEYMPFEKTLEDLTKRILTYSVDVEKVKVVFIKENDFVNYSNEIVSLDYILNLPTVDNLIVLAALLNVRIDDILVVN